MEINGKFWRKLRVVGGALVLLDKVLRSHRHGYGLLLRFGADGSDQWLSPRKVLVIVVKSVFAFAASIDP